MRKTISVCLLLLFGAAPMASALDLIQTYELAVQNDPTLRQALADYESAKETRPQAKAQLLPNLSVNGDANRVYQDTRKSPTGRTGSDTFNSSGISIDLFQPVYRRDRFYQLQQTDDLIASADAQYLAAEQDLMYRTAQAYFGILDAQENVKFAEANKKAIARQLDQAKQRFEVGLIAITDVHEAQAAYDGARSTEIAAKNDVDSAWEALLQIIGPRPVEEIATLKPDFPLTPPEPADLEQWSETALKQNLSVLAAYHRAELARKGIEVQRSGHYPTLDLVASYGVDDTTGDAASRFDTGVIGLQLAVPLYQGGGVSSRVRQAQYDFQSAQDSLDAQRRSVDRVVKDAYRGVETSISQVEALAATVVSSQSALEATEAGYEVGTRTIIDVLNVQRNKFDADRNYAVARYAYILNGLLLKGAASILSPDDLKQVNVWLQ